MNVQFKTLKKHFPSFSRGFNDKKPVFYTHEKIPSDFAHEIVNMRHTGWYTNEDGETFKDGSGLCLGIVLYLPPMPGFADGRYLAGYNWGDNGESVIWPEMFSDREDAAREADYHAEKFAEICREDNAKWNAAQKIEDKIEDEKSRLVECIALRHKKCLKYIREEIREICETIRELTEKRAEMGDF